MKRHSQKRVNILSVLRESNEALSANSIHNLLPTMDLVTVYRNLDSLVEEGMVKKLYLKGTSALFEFQHQPHHHAICTNCDRVIHFTAQDEKIKKLLGLADFQVDELEVTVKGVCNHNK